MLVGFGVGVAVAFALVSAAAFPTACASSSELISIPSSACGSATSELSAAPASSDPLPAAFVSSVSAATAASAVPVSSAACAVSGISSTLLCSVLVACAMSTQPDTSPAVVLPQMPSLPVSTSTSICNFSPLAMLQPPDTVPYFLPGPL